MQVEWITATGVILVLIALIVAVLGPRLLTRSPWRNIPSILHRHDTVASVLLQPGIRWRDQHGAAGVDAQYRHNVVDQDS